MVQHVNYATQQFNLMLRYGIIYGLHAGGTLYDWSKTSKKHSFKK